MAYRILWLLTVAESHLGHISGALSVEKAGKTANRRCGGIAVTTLTIIVANGATQPLPEAQADPNMTAPMGLNVGTGLGWDSFEWPNATAETGDGFSFNPEGQKTVNLGSYQDPQGNYWFLVPVQDDD
jgi:hypothetical protein